VKKIFTTKKRPMDNPLISHLGKKSQITTYAHIDNDLQRLLIKKLMPGPFTILLRPKSMIPKEITAGQPLMSVRIPDNTICRKLLS
jgi:L-threonylcarbamoyladenylate synthase